MAINDQPVEVVETHWIPLGDGRRLAARLFLPASAASDPVPLIVEQTPYRRRDFSRVEDDLMHRWLAARGYAVARVDTAGTGDSSGLLEDEHTAREHRDLVEAIEHLCGQPWCTGVAGMIGMSWGGFTALQVAALRPPRLKAIITVNSSVDRHALDAHFSGGLLLADHFVWGAALAAFAALPPDPEVVGPGWRDAWLSRLDATSVFAADWLRHQRRDDYWKQGSVAEDYAALDCPVLTVGGWFDGYPQTVLDLLENHPGTCKGIIGPWGHSYPVFAPPEHAIGFLQECVRWFDRWLKGVDTGVERDPTLRCHVMDAPTLVGGTDGLTGRWLGLPSWPPVDREVRRADLDACERWGWGQDPGGQGDLAGLTSPADTGGAAQEWCAGLGAAGVEGAAEQGDDDRRSLCFDQPPLAEDLQVVGAPVAVLRLSAAQPQASVAVRLTSVSPDGASTLLSFGVLNLSHRASPEHPEPLTPGAAETVTVRLKPVAVRVPAGHRLRVAVSTAYWPMTWPAAEPVELTIDAGGSAIEIPVLPTAAPTEPVAFGDPVTADGPAVDPVAPSRFERSTSVDDDGRAVVEAVMDGGRWHLRDVDLVLGVGSEKSMRVRPSGPAAATGRFSFRVTLARGDWRVDVESLLDVAADHEAFALEGVVRALEGDELIAERRARHVVPRDHL